MRPSALEIVIVGLSITSSWGNGHATTYRGLIKALSARGHRIVFLERDQEWYASNRDLPHPPYCETHLYTSVSELKRRFADRVREADLVVLGSYVPGGIAIGEWITRKAQGLTAFYDIDTPVTLAALEAGRCEYLSATLIPEFQRYLSFTGGPTLERIEREYGSPCARPLYCSVDPAVYYPEKRSAKWDLGYLGTYSADRQPGLERLLIAPAKAHPKLRAVVAGPQYPDEITWPANVQRVTHLPPGRHRRFYSEQRFTLNLTRQAMVQAGFSPSVRLFEAAACGTPIISDYWTGLESFFQPGREILVARGAEDIHRYLREWPEAERLQMAERARACVLAEHTAAHRALELEEYALGGVQQLNRAVSV